jgi:hypothetical protein
VQDVALAAPLWFLFRDSTLRSYGKIVNYLRMMLDETSILSDDRAATGRAADVPSWQKAGVRYHTYRHFLHGKFGARRVQKVSLDAGFTCPNVDGTVAIGGCTFCDNRSFSPSRRN